MKKLFLCILIVIALCSGKEVFAQFPIPSYGTEIRGTAYFTGHGSLERAKRMVKIKRTCTSTGSESGTLVRVWVFTLDRTVILGPYYLACGQTLEIPIDEREWGVAVESEEPVIIDVWFTENEGPVPLN